MKIICERTPNENIFYIGTTTQKDAYITFLQQDNILTIEHTIVSEKLKGQGIGKLLVEEVAQFARKNNLKVNATCPFARGLLYSQESYEDIRV